MDEQSGIDSLLTLLQKQISIRRACEPDDVQDKVNKSLSVQNADEIGFSLNFIASLTHGQMHLLLMLRNSHASQWSGNDHLDDSRVFVSPLRFTISATPRE